MHLIAFVLRNLNELLGLNLHFEELFFLPFLEFFNLTIYSSSLWASDICFILGIQFDYAFSLRCILLYLSDFFYVFLNDYAGLLSLVLFKAPMHHLDLVSRQFIQSEMLQRYRTSHGMTRDPDKGKSPPFSQDPV